MKTLAILAGLVFIALAVAGFAGMIAMPPMYAAVLGISGVAFAIFGLSRRRAMVPTRRADNDMRDFV